MPNDYQSELDALKGLHDQMTAAARAFEAAVPDEAIHLKAAAKYLISTLQGIPRVVQSALESQERNDAVAAQQQQAAQQEVAPQDAKPAPGTPATQAVPETPAAVPVTPASTAPATPAPAPVAPVAPVTPPPATPGQRGS